MRKLSSAYVLAAALLTGSAMAQNAKPAAGSGFSFDVYGDSRSLLFLPYRQDQEAEARRYMADLYELALSEQVATDVVARDANPLQPIDPRAVADRRASAR